MLMKQTEDYVAPAVEVIEVIEEKSFCSNGGTAKDEDTRGSVDGMPWG